MGIKTNSKIEVYNQLLYRYLDTNGDGTGDKNINGDYSSVVTPFFIKPPDGYIYRLTHIIGQIADGGSIDAGNYGNGIELDQGISVQISNDSEVLVDLTDGVNIMTNNCWGRLGFKIDHAEYGSGSNYLTFTSTFCVCPTLSGSKNEKFSIIFNDDFDRLVSQYFMAIGYWYLEH